jgi:transcriptional regulator
MLTRVIMALSAGYLTPKQLKVWDLKRRGSPEAEIARELKISRQTIHKAADVAESKVAQALMETASLNKIRVKVVDPVIGVLSGYSPEFKTPVIITFSAKNGVQIWYKHEGDCTSCDQLENCRKTLLAEMEERNIRLPKNLGSMSPSKISEFLFQRLMVEERENGLS